MKLVIVESPAKAKTIEKYLGKDFKVEASFGHIRNLADKGEHNLGIDIKNGKFYPIYQIDTNKKKQVDKLKDLVSKSNFVYLASDPDREGEAISWHLEQTLGLNKGNVPYKRVTFHEITKNAVNQAIQSPSEIDMGLVNSQKTRQMLDKIIGYLVSGFLLRNKVSRSAGRVQSVALLLVCEREEEIQNFKPEEYWNIIANFSKDGINFSAKLEKYNKNGQLVDIKLKNQEMVDRTLNQLGDFFTVTNIEYQTRERSSKAPLTTSTLQQNASSKLGFDTKKTMDIAQKLYEGKDLGSERVGLITYMRTDSTRLSDDFTKETMDLIKNTFGPNYVGKIKKGKKSDNVQDAHEAIRPTSPSRMPKDVRPYLTADEFALYELIYYHTIASLMANAQIDQTIYTMDNNNLIFIGKGEKMRFDGFLKVYKHLSKKESEDKEGEEDITIPNLQTGETFNEYKIDPQQKFTSPPSRYTEAKLVHELEKRGIGRPSTYSSIMNTLKERQYVVVEKKVFVPTELGKTTNKVLQQYFQEMFNVEYTADMEEKLDRIANGDVDYNRELMTSYTLVNRLLDHANEKIRIDNPDLIPKVETIGRNCPKCGGDLVKRMSKKGTEFIGCVNYSDKSIKCDYTEFVVPDDAKPCPKCGKPLIERKSKNGKFLGCTGYPNCDYLENIPDPRAKKCPECKNPMRKIKGPNGDFYGCTNYPNCKHTESLKGKGSTKAKAKKTDKKCSECGSPMVIRKGKDGNEFYGCSSFPNCRHTEPKK